LYTFCYFIAELIPYTIFLEGKEIIFRSLRF